MIATCIIILLASSAHSLSHIGQTAICRFTHSAQVKAFFDNKKPGHLSTTRALYDLGGDLIFTFQADRANRTATRYVKSFEQVREKGGSGFAAIFFGADGTGFGMSQEGGLGGSFRF